MYQEWYWLFPFHNMPESLHVLEITACNLERNSESGSHNFNSNDFWMTIMITPVNATYDGVA